MISAAGKLTERLAVCGWYAVRGVRFWTGSLAAAVLVLSTALAAPPKATEPATPSPPPEPSPMKFVKHQIGNFRSEAFGVGDFNNDGKLDIVAGPYLYLAPEFKPIQYREVKGAVGENGKGYMHDFANLPLDCDGDGWLDVVYVDWFAQECAWFRNPGKAGGLWTKHVIDNKCGNLESADLWDITGEGKAVHILPAAQQTFWYELVKGPDGARKFVKHMVSEKRMTWGCGVGDVNGDGRPDILRPNAWFEAPADPRNGVWKEHPLPIGESAQMWTYDVNGDGLNDIICSSAHGYGVFWYEQVRQDGQIEWKQHVIDKSWSQAHSLTLADIDGCGVPELITGKRFMAHNGSDPDEYGKLGLYYYKLIRKPDKTVEWKKYAISYDEGIGAGMSIWVGDLRGSGKKQLDVVTTGKFGGPVWFENKGFENKGK
ncbi:MAG: VCBS repeat-containing protein [Thermoguttaceae bacterium]|jgi:hypothetical protein